MREELSSGISASSVDVTSKFIFSAQISEIHLSIYKYWEFEVKDF